MAEEHGGLRWRQKGVCTSCDLAKRVASMVPHSGPFVLVLSVTLFGSLHTVSLNRDAEEPSWTHKNAVTEPTRRTLTSAAKMDATTPPMINSLFSDLTTNSENKNALSRASVFKSRRDMSFADRPTTWIENTTPFKTDSTTRTSTTRIVTQGNEQSDLVGLHFGNMAHSSKNTLAPTLKPSPHPPSQVQNPAFGSPEYTRSTEFIDFHMSQTSPDHGRVESGLSADWTLGKSKATAQRTNIEELSDSIGLRKGLKDLPTARQDSGEVVEEFTKKPPRAKMVVTNSPKGNIN